MLIWNVKDSSLQGAKTKGRYFSFGEEVPENEIGDAERKKAMLERGWLKVEEAKPAKPAATPLPAPGPKPEASPAPKSTKAESKPKSKKGKR